MAFANKQHKTAGYTTTAAPAVAFASTVAAGNLLICAVVDASASGASFTNFTDSQGAVWNTAGTFSGTTVSETLAIGWAIAASSAANTVTAHWGVSNSGDMYVQEFTFAVGATIVQDGAALSTQGTSATVNVPSLTTTGANDAIFHVAGCGNPGTIVSPWTGDAGGLNTTAAWRLNLPPGAYTPNVTQTSAAFASLIFGLSEILPAPPPRPSLPRRLGPAAVGPTFFAAQQRPAAPSGSGPVQNTSTLSAVLTFTGAQGRTIGHLLTATLGFAAAKAIALAKALTAAAVGFTATVAKRTGHLLAATLGFSGAFATAIVHLFGQALSATLTFTATQTRTIAKLLAAAVTFTASRMIAAAHLILAALTFTASQARRTGNTLAAALTFTATQTRTVGKRLAGAVTFTAAQARAVRRLLAAALTFTGAQTRQTATLLAAVLASTGAQARRTAHLTVAMLTFTGAHAKATAMQLAAAALSFTGAFATAVVHVFHTALSAAVTFTGNLASAKSFGRAFTATLTFTGANARQTAKLLAATLTFTAAQARRTGKTLVSAASFTASQTRLIAARLAGATLTFTGAFASNRFVGKALAAALTFTGSLTSHRLVSRAFTATLAFTGAQTRRTMIAMNGAVSLAGNLGRSIGQGFRAGVSFLGNVVGRLISAKPAGKPVIAVTIRPVGPAAVTITPLVCALTVQSIAPIPATVQPAPTVSVTVTPLRAVIIEGI